MLGSEEKRRALRGPQGRQEGHPPGPEVAGAPGMG